MTCSRFGRPKAVINGSLFTSAARTCPRSAADDNTAANSFSMFQGAAPTPPSSAAGFQPLAANAGFSQSSTFSADQTQELSETSSSTFSPDLESPLTCPADT